jgi:hypothetical protein
MDRRNDRLVHLPSKIIYMSRSRKAATAGPALIMLSGKGRMTK